jgi:PAS domain S-box-containing protein
MNKIPASMPPASSYAEPKGTEAELVESKLIDELPLPYIEMDAQGAITRVNAATLKLHPREQGELIGRMAWDFIVTDERESGRAAYLSFMETGEEPPPIHRSLFDRSGEFRVYELHRSLKRDAEGRPTGMRMLCIDVTEAKREMEEIRQTRRNLDSVLASLPAVVVVTDALGFVRYVNPAAEELHGWSAADLIGTVIEERLHVISCVTEDQGFLIPRVKLERRTQGIITAIDSAGRKARFEITTAPVVEQETGSTTGVVSVTRRLMDEDDRSVSRAAISSPCRVRGCPAIPPALP